jgi:hypothetical protein
MEHVDRGAYSYWQALTEDCASQTTSNASSDGKKMPSMGDVNEFGHRFHTVIDLISILELITILLRRS